MTTTDLSWEKYTLEFIRPAKTSRDTLQVKPTWFVRVSNPVERSIEGLGECSPIWGLSPERPEDYESVLTKLSEDVRFGQFSQDDLVEFPSIRCGLEMAMLDLINGGKRKYFDSAFYRGESPIRINGLIWMGDLEFMKEQISAKLDSGFHCIKLKIGSHNWHEEFELLSSLRKEYSSKDLELRVDANGAFSPSEAPELLKQLSELEIHSIEQPIKQGQVDEMATLCENTPTPIALDEELIGVTKLSDKQKLIQNILPQYLILKPSLLGGFQACQEWIDLAQKNEIDWWVTSALESNVGLNAIAQWTATLNNPLPQGLGTGMLYRNNVPSPLRLEGEMLYHSM